MDIILNDVLTPLPTGCITLEDLVRLKEIKLQGTAIAVNDKIIRKDKWDITKLSNLDRVTVITAAFGG